MKSRTKVTKLFTDLVLEVFHFNGALLSTGDRLSRPLSLSSARWQVLGAVMDEPRSVAQIARAMGLTRQGVQRQADILEGQEFILYAENPDHKRAKLVSLTRKGQLAMSRLSNLQLQWAKEVTAGITGAEIENALRLIKKITSQLKT
jgi:DNA-binding MarR family transcriptional regulator